MFTLYALLGSFGARIVKNTVLKQSEDDIAEGKTNMGELFFLIATGYMSFFPFKAFGSFQGIIVGMFTTSMLDFVSEKIKSNEVKTGKTATGLTAMLVNQNGLYVTSNNMYVNQALYVTQNILQDLEKSTEYEFMNVNCENMEYMPTRAPIKMLAVKGM